MNEQPRKEFNVENAKENKLIKRGFRAYMRRNYLLYVMLVPMIAYFVLFSYYPMLGLQIAFKDWKMTKGMWGSPWAVNAAGGLDLFKHFRLLFGDPKVLGKFFNTLRISCLRILFGFPMPILLAILMNELTGARFKKTVQTISYLPYFISWVIISGIIFAMVKTGSSLQNFFTSLFGAPVQFFGNDNLFLGVVVVSDIWKSAGWGTVIYFAALTSIDPSLYEAATVDGANRFRRILHITMPGIVPALSINLIFTLSGVVYGGFDQIYNLYNTAVYGKGDILETYIFRIGITDGQYDIATALGLFNSLIAFALTLLANFTVKKAGGTPIW